MPTPLVDYYRELQIREGLTPTELIAEWDNTAVNEISADFSAAMTNSQMTQQVVPIRPGSSNQSVGNQVADFFTLQFPAFLAKHVIRACSGAGYPDKILVCKLDKQPFPLELKQRPDGMPPILIGAPLISQVIETILRRVSKLAQIHNANQ